MKLSVLLEVIDVEEANLPPEYTIERYLNPESGNLEVIVCAEGLSYFREFSPGDTAMSVCDFIRRS